jgi:hypothetical protein
VRCSASARRAQIAAAFAGIQNLMETCVMSQGKQPELEVVFRSFKISARGLDAIRAVRWPLALLLVAFAIVIVIVSLRSHPIDAALALIDYFKN